MTKNDFKIDFEKKKIFHNPKGTNKIYALTAFYSFLQDTFDEPENMKYEIPIVAKSKDRFELINGWTIDEKALKYLKGNLFTF